MRYQTFSINQWLFPDTGICQQTEAVTLHGARNADVCFQILTDTEVPERTVCSWRHTFPEGYRVTLLQLMPVCVPHNSSDTYHTTDDYESVKDFVTRRAPFDVYDLTVPVDDGLQAGRAAFLVRIDVPADAEVGCEKGSLTVKLGDAVIDLELSLTVHKPVLGAPKDSPYGMINWIYPEILCRLHGVERFSEEYYRWYERYF
jgi:hypothetical protein